MQNFFSTQESYVHPQQLATLNRLNRRRNFRISYPHLGPVMGLPAAHIGKDEIIVKNISTGGLLAIDDTGVIGQSLGTDLELTLRWVEQSFTIKSRVVGAQLQRRHLQFVDFHPEVFKRIAGIIPSAFSGSRFRKINSEYLSSPTAELWTGHGTDNLKIGSLAQVHHLVLNGKTFELHPNEVSWYEGQQRVDSLTQTDILITLSNIPAPSSELKLLIERTNDYFADLRKTGS